ncbi:MAG: hypothetical protein H0U61_07925 [Nocardioidaceae bacterium]|nr:hypothetical protein [Nocardioidaceae bacterium]
MLVCFDATVLCGALRKPTGLNFRLLQLASDGVLFDGFTTEVAGIEFVRNALEGLSGVRYEIELIEAFLDSFGPLFDPEHVASSPIGRSLSAQTWLHNKPVGEVVYHLTGRTREELLDGLPEQLRVVSGEFDAHDVHLVAAAVERGADVICSSNRRHLPEGPLAGGIEVFGPGRLAAALDVA